MFEDIFISGAFTKHRYNVYGFANYVFTVKNYIKCQTLITLSLTNQSTVIETVYCRTSCQYGHGLSFVFSGLVHCMEIGARIFIPFCYSNSPNIIVHLATSRVWVDCVGHLKRLIQSCLNLG